MVKAAAQRILSLLPGGRFGNRLLQRYVSRSLELDENQFEVRLTHCRKHLENFFPTRGSSEPGFSVFELGTGWHPIIPIGMYLCGASRVTTLDIEPLLNRERVCRTLDLYRRSAERGALATVLPWILEERVETLLHLLQHADSPPQGDLLHPMEIYPVVGDAAKIEGTLGSFDLVFSNSTLQYIPADELGHIFGNLRRIVGSQAVMSHHIYLGYDLAIFDSSVSPFYFLRFSRAAWKLVDNPLHSHNRLRLSDYHRIHASNGWTVKKEETLLGAPEDLQKIPLAKEFQGYSERDLLALRAWLFSCPA
jgi:hypothetical protein